MLLRLECIIRNQVNRSQFLKRVNVDSGTHTEAHLSRMLRFQVCALPISHYCILTTIEPVIKDHGIKSKQIGKSNIPMHVVMS